MQRTSHVIGGLLAGILLGTRLSLTPVQIAAGLAIATICGFLPDQIQWSSSHVEWKFVEGHRGFSHTMLFAGLAWLLLAAFHPAAGAFCFVGLCSHYLLDLPGDMGIPLFWPIIRHRIALGWFNNNGRGEIATRLIMLAAVFAILAYSIGI